MSTIRYGKTLVSCSCGIAIVLLSIALSMTLSTIAPVIKSGCFGDAKTYTHCQSKGKNPSTTSSWEFPRLASFSPMLLMFGASCSLRPIFKRWMAVFIATALCCFFFWGGRGGFRRKCPIVYVQVLNTSLFLWIFKFSDWSLPSRCLQVKHGIVRTGYYKRWYQVPQDRNSYTLPLWRV